MKTCNINLFKIYNSTISYVSKAFSNFSKKISKLRLVSIKSTKLERDLQPILKSLGKFFVDKDQFVQTFDCKQHLLRLVKILANENILSVSNWNPIIPKICLAQKPIVRNILPCFSHQCNGHLMFLTLLDNVLKNYPKTTKKKQKLPQQPTVWKGA